MFYIFNVQGESVATANNQPNLEDLATRGEQAVETDEIFINPIFVDGSIIERGEKPSDFHHWNGTAWQLDEAGEQAQFTQHKRSLLAEITTKTDRLKAEILAGYPQTEIDSFYRQEREARAWRLDPQIAVPMLSAIAENRGVSLAVLVEKVIEKADQIAAVIGAIIGTRQGFEDRINAAQTLAELDALALEVEQWQG